MNDQDWIDAGIIKGAGIEHFHVLASSMGCVLSGVLLMEPGRNAWGQNPAKFRENVLRDLAPMVMGIEATGCFGGKEATNVRLLQELSRGNPEIQQAMKEGRLRFLVGKEASGLRRVACAIAPSGTTARRPAMASEESGATPPDAGPACLGLILILMTIAAGLLLSLWLWSLSAEKIHTWTKIVIIVVVVALVRALAKTISTHIIERAASAKQKK